MAELKAQNITAKFGISPRLIEGGNVAEIFQIPEGGHRDTCKFSMTYSDDIVAVFGSNRQFFHNLSSTQKNAAVTITLNGKGEQGEFFHVIAIGRQG